jgi:hypothetical protein
MNRYKITADNLKHPITLHAESETEAWEQAKKIYLKIADKRLLNGKVTPIMEEAEKDARIAELEEALHSVENALFNLHDAAMTADLEKAWRVARIALKR